MKKLFFMIFFLLASLLDAKIIEYKTKILSIEGNVATAPDANFVPIGSSGIVVHNFGKNHSSIVAKVIVISKKGNYLKIRFKKFDDLKQEVLPIPKILPKVGDTVVLNYLYDHALAITPNYKAYKEITSKYKNISWLHPDLFASELFADSNPSPNKEDFQKFCKEYSFSLLYFAVGDEGYFIDCNSFKVLQKERLEQIDSKKIVPFYSRVKDIDTSWISFGKSKISDYDSYYKMLLRQ